MEAAEADRLPEEEVIGQVKYVQPIMREVARLRHCS